MRGRRERLCTCRTPMDSCPVCDGTNAETDEWYRQPRRARDQKEMAQHYSDLHWRVLHADTDPFVDQPELWQQWLSEREFFRDQWIIWVRNKYLVNLEEPQ